MKSSPIFPRDEQGSGNDVDYDPQADFQQFLREARKNASALMLESLCSPSTPAGNTKTAGDKKKRISWKNALFFWRKLTRRSSGTGNPDAFAEEASNGRLVWSAKRRAAVSGPITGGQKKSSCVQRPASGPLAGLFTPKRAKDNEVAYRTLDHQRYPSRVEAFGPIYKVT